MTSPIDPPGSSPRIRRTRKTAAELLDELEAKARAQAPGLPVPVSPPRTVSPKTPQASAAQIEAQLIGERRGLKAGASVIDQAKTSYTRTEWSGSKDRRAPKGRAAKTEI
jgi:hypothetical protein